ncbi:hypothetical protein HIM_04377 [Hirsutella minnesotensis 3608]|uniref:Arf-GAP domain-containing protein n=1 Tax=Hirsutella minnesotensis 3608 TaxID=1043627 RepID=A0A0F7ZPY2_9HYPO|nr:hypothetical protein HIM_04377 [Hirsutella minnesotensis 3608]
MSAVLSKRQQARNEKVLQELVQRVPGNNRCADCHLPNPAWASWSLGVFLCMRCAAIHRKLGTHISKVKSLSMDSWSNEQVDNMRKVGNVVSNQVYNPENKRPPVPVDADEADSAMERFIRHKYINNVASELAKPRSPLSDEGTPPPLPPKNATKFGFRSASSIFPLSSKAKKEAKMAAAINARPASPSSLTNKPSKVFGATVDFDASDDVGKKLARLRDMGFQDQQRNAMVLKGVNGSVERAVEALVRLGEGSPTSATSPRESMLRTSKSLTPLTSKPNDSGIGLSVSRGSAEERPTSASTTWASANPFDTLTATQPQTAQSTGSLQYKNPYGTWGDASRNPFGHPPQQVDAINQAFQGLTVSAPPQGLFPHRTGDMGVQGFHQQQPAYQHIMSPSAPSTPSGYQQPINFQSAMTYPQPFPQHQQLLPQSYQNNPFLSQPSSPAQSLVHPPSLSVGASPIQGAAMNNPFSRTPIRIASPALGQIPEQGQSNFLTASPQPLPTNSNPFFVDASPIAQQSAMQHTAQAAWSQQPAYAQQQAQAHSQGPTRRQDNAAIMALFNQPYQAPQQPRALEAGVSSQAAVAYGSQSTPHGAHSNPVASSIDQPRSASQPFGSGNNPFMTNGMPAMTSDPFPSHKHVSRESMNLGMEMNWTNGRHSPDAFASLSARHV